MKLPLYDKEDETDVGMNNDMHHSYYLYFKRSENDSPIKYEVNRNSYIEAVLGAEYLVAVTPTNYAVAAYQSSNWSIAEDLKPYVIVSETADGAFHSTDNTLYQVNTTPAYSRPEKPKSYCLSLLWFLLF